MRSLILHPTDTYQWYALINEAQAATHIVLNESVESYLVFLLMRYTQGVNWIDSIIALDFLENMNKPRQQQLNAFKEIGDRSLMFCGLFPGIAAKRKLSLDYYHEMGKAAYLTVSELETAPNIKLYYQLSEHFIDLEAILGAIRIETDNEKVQVCERSF